MSDDDPGGPVEQSLRTNQPVEEMFGHVSVHSTERIVQQVELSLSVGSPGQRQPLFLASTQVEAALSDLSLVSRGQKLKVRAEGTG